MIWLILFLLPLSDGVKASEDYLVYGLEKEKSIEFYKTNFDLANQELLFKIESYKDPIGRIYLIRQNDKDILYWNYINSTNFGRFEIGTEKNYEEKSLTQGIFVGLGEGEGLYVYYPKLKQISICNFNKKEIKNVIKSSTLLKKIHPKMRCSDVDPRRRQEIYFADCNENTKEYFGKVYDVDKDEIQDSPEQKLPACFDSWKITPNALLAYAAKDTNIYLSPEEWSGYDEFYEADAKITNLVAGNEALFYSTVGKRKIFKVVSETKTKGKYEKELDVNGKVVALALIQ